MKLPFWATLFVTAGTLVLCALGVWQLKRLVWKEALLARISTEYKVNTASVALDPSEDLTNALLRRGYLEGTYIHDKAVQLIPRVYQGQPGYHLITPFLVAQDNVVFVNRGWVPLDVDPADPRITKPEGLIRITGALRPAPQKNSFTPKNTPQQGQWYHVAPQELAQAQGYQRYYDNVFYKEPRTTTRGGSPDLPIAQGTFVHIANNHAGYALFWFIMAATLPVIYYLRFIAPSFRQRFRIFL